MNTSSISSFQSSMRITLYSPFKKRSFRKGKDEDLDMSSPPTPLRPERIEQRSNQQITTIRSKIPDIADRHQSLQEERGFHDKKNPFDQRDSARGGDTRSRAHQTAIGRGESPEAAADPRIPRISTPIGEIEKRTKRRRLL